MTPRSQDNRLEAFNAIVDKLKTFETTEQIHILDSVARWLNISIHLSDGYSAPRSRTSIVLNEPGESILDSNPTYASPKEFLREKHPETNVERIACLGFYLTHYRDTPYFKTLDISKLNTEAAQPKFSNASYAMRDATNAGLLVSAPKNAKQLSAMGEQFVIALPNRVMARETLLNMRPKRTRKAKHKKSAS